MKKLFMVLMLLLSGCATSGQPFDMSLTDRIKIGQTTQEEVIALLGQPISTSKTSDGRTFLSYSYSQAAWGSADVQIFSVVIGADGRVEKTYSNSTSR